jgi:hypothetical protein
VPLRRELAKLFVAAGWKKVNDVLRRDESPEWSMVVGLGALNKREDVSAALGIRSESVQQLHTELRGLENPPNVATVGADSGYVTGGSYKIWAAPQDAVEDIYDSILQGLESLRPFMSLERVSEAYAAIPATEADPSAHYRMVVIELLRGRPEAVAEMMLRAEKIYCRRDDEICEDFRAFQEKTRARFPQLVR